MSQSKPLGFGYGKESNACAIFKADLRHILDDWWVLNGNVITGAGWYVKPQQSVLGVDRLESVGETDPPDGLEWTEGVLLRVVQHD